MAVGGACPGMVVAQMGSFTENSMYTLAGLLAGKKTLRFSVSQKDPLSHHPHPHAKVFGFMLPWNRG